MGIQKPYKNDELYELLKNGTEWESKEEKYNDAKNTIKQYLKTVNHKTCFFCKRKINTGNNAGTIEHILDKKNYGMYMFKPENLTYTCAMCNTLKRNINVLSEEELKRKTAYTYDNYPMNSDDYIIVHPYLDDYDGYIIIDDIFYKAKDGKKKGQNTIKFYHLTRLDLAEDKIKVDPSSFQNTFLQNILQGMNIDVDEAVDYVFNNKTNNDDDVCVSDVPLRFIDNYLNTDNTDKLVEAINVLDDEKVKILREYRNLLNDININLKYDYINILKSDFYKLNSEEKLVEDVEVTLKSLSTLMRSKERIKEIKKIDTVDMFAIIVKFKNYFKEPVRNKQITLIKKLSNLLVCLEFYNYKSNIDIKNTIKEDIDMLKKIKKELKLLKKVAK